jgi:hypothetical protein
MRDPAVAVAVADRLRAADKEIAEGALLLDSDDLLHSHLAVMRANIVGLLGRLRAHPLPARRPGPDDTRRSRPPWSSL